MSSVLASCLDFSTTRTVREPEREPLRYLEAFHRTAHALTDGEPITLSALLREVLADVRAGSLPSVEDPPGASIRSC